MADIPDKLVPILRDLASVLARGQECYLVGGTVRDWLLGRDTADMDLAVSGGAGKFAARAAALLGGTAFVMDIDRDVHRVVIKADEHLQVDVSPLKGGIEEDLARRDFTINAMAIRIHPHPPAPSPMKGRGGAACKGGEITSYNLPSPPARVGPGVGAILDPYGGISDLNKKLIRALGRETLPADPLRMLRAFRLAGALGFEIEQKTLACIEDLAYLVSSVSGERARDELYMMLERPGAPEAFGEMAMAGLLKAVLPETAAMEGLPQGEPHRHDLLTHSLKAMWYAELVVDYPERYFGAREREAREYLSISVDGPLTNRGLVKLAALLHDIGKPRTMVRDEGRIRFTGHDEAGAAIAASIAQRLKFSTRASDCLVQVTKGHMRPLHISQGVPTRHALYRYVRDMGECLPASLIVALADAMATRDNPDVFPTDVEGLVRDVAEYYYGEYTSARAEPLIKGQDLIDVFGLMPGPLFKVILDDVAEKRATGFLKDRKGALDYIRGWLEKERK